MKMSAKRFATACELQGAVRPHPQVGVVVHPEPRHGRQPWLDLAEFSRFDACPEDGLDPPFEFATALPELLGALAGQRRELVQEDPHMVGIAGDDLEQLISQQRQLLRG